MGQYGATEAANGMFGITDKLRSAAAAGGLVAVAGTLALIGLVWITIAAFTVLALYVTPPVAMLIIGLVLMVPLAVVLVQTRSGKPKLEEEPLPPSGEYEAIARLAGTARGLADKSPIAGAAIALGAAYFAARSPATSPLALQILAEAIDQWAASKSSEKTSDTHEDDPSI